jgi:multidrug efflux pump subunit AcrA (membrane-fusion protein)
MRRWWILILIVVLLAAGAATMLGRQPSAPPTQAAPGPVPVEVAKAQRGTVVRAIEISGTVTSAKMAGIFAKISGRVARVLVEDGTRVRAGQPLLQLDAADQRAEVAQVEAGVRAAVARLQIVERGPRPQERQVVFNAYTQAKNQVRAAETQVTLARASLKVAEDNLRRHEQLVREGAIAQAQVDQARLQYDQARAQLQAAETQLEIARAALDSAAQQWNMTETGARVEEVQAARAQVAQARALAAIARQRLANMTLRAPFAGRVTGLDAVVGDYLTSGDFGGRGVPVLQVYDDQAMEVEVKIGERDLSLVSLGQRARLRLETASGTAVEAKVRLISPAADPASRSATVRLRLTGAAPDAVPGTFARGDIVVEERRGVILVPQVAISGDPASIRVVVGDVVQVRRVALGVSQDSQVEVRSGVAEGERVVVLGPETLTAGTKVQVVNR